MSEKKLKSEVKSKGSETFFFSYPSSSYRDSTVLYNNLRIIIWFAKNGSCSSKNKYIGLINCAWNNGIEMGSSAYLEGVSF